MAARQISSPNELPQLVLPSGALAPDDPAHEYNPDTDPPAIEPIEHKLRVDFMEAGPPDSRSQLLKAYNHYSADPSDPDPWASDGGSNTKPLGLQYAERSIRAQWDSEQRFFDNYDCDSVLEDAPAYLASALRDCRTATHPDQAVGKERRKREKWYRLMPYKNLYTVFKQDTLGEFLKPSLDGSPTPGMAHQSLHGTNSFQTTYEGILVIDDDSSAARVASTHDVDPNYIKFESAFVGSSSNSDSPDLPVPSEYGIKLPAPLIVGHYPNNSSYLFLPWTGGLTCQCPFKIGKPYRVTCKHEVLAAFVLSSQESIFLPVDKGINIPARATRFINPTIAISHNPER